MACTIADCILMFSDIPTFGWSNPHSWLACSPHVVQLSPNQISGSKKWKKGNHCTKTTIDSAEWHSKPTMARSKPNDLHLWFRVVGKHTTGIVRKKSARPQVPTDYHFSYEKLPFFGPTSGSRANSKATRTMASWWVSLRQWRQWRQWRQCTGPQIDTEKSNLTGPV